MYRKILHLDLDAFFCAVEELRDPALRGQPFAVGGRPEERGVVASCSYAARRCGVRSAMPMAKALKLCPNLIIVASRYHVYGDMSRQVMQRFSGLTPLVEQISIDEAFLDLSDLPEPPEELARRLQQTINRELKLPCSIGTASNKLVAKIANDVGKAGAKKGEPPNAITVVPPGNEAAFLAPLPVLALWGVGPKTADRLEELGIRTIGDLAHWPADDLQRRFGKNGLDLAQHARGIDERPIVTTHEAKSVSQETTFVRDVSDEKTLLRTLFSLAEGVGRQLRSSHLCCSTVKIKVRWPDFTTFTRQVTLAEPTDQDIDIYQAALALFKKEWRPLRPVRLLGVGGSGLGPPARQLSLWDTRSEKDRKLQETVDTLRERYGDKAVQRGSQFNKHKEG